VIGRLNHVAIAVPDLEAATATYRNTLGAEVGAPQDEPDHGVTVFSIRLGRDRPSPASLRKTHRAAFTMSAMRWRIFWPRAIS